MTSAPREHLCFTRLEQPVSVRGGFHSREKVFPSQEDHWERAMA
jgi:hypothetical protein